MLDRSINPRGSTRRNSHGPALATPAPILRLLTGFAAAGFAAAITWQAGGGLLLSLLAYSFAGSLGLLAATFAVVAIPRRRQLARMFVSRRRTAPASAFSH